MNRRDALKLLIALPVVAGCGSSVLTVSAREDNNTLIVDAADFRKGTGEYYRALLVRPRNSRYPIFLFRDDAGAITALSGECTHKGCEVQLAGDILACPCHGSEFSSDGAVQNGPATKNLRTFRVTQNEKTIRIYLS